MGKWKLQYGIKTIKYLKGQSRTQLTLYTTCLEDMIHEDHSVRAIDPLVYSRDFNTLGFQTITWQGIPPYNPSDLLKLYIYGYMNKIRSSGQLELECSRNIELMWLLGNLKTIPYQKLKNASNASRNSQKINSELFYPYIHSTPKN
ncbi:transposase [Flavobacteriaceae bacterium M23B6Z8]